MKITHKHKIIVIMIFVIISIMINIYAFVRPTPLIAIIHRILIKKDLSRVTLNIGLDKMLLKEVPEGNLFIKFKGYESLDKESDIDIPLMIYMRAYYTRYPMKTYVVKPGVTVNKGEDILKNPFNPTKDWLRDHGVKKVITFTQRKVIIDGKEQIFTYNKIESVD